MRWPWQRGTAEPRTDEAPREPVATAAVEPPVAPAGWAFLPPLQRTIASFEPTSDPEHFAGTLASWGDPSFTGPMTHLVSTQAPAGVIDADGGGPVPAGGGYPEVPGEMALLPPPAPAVRPTQVGYGSVQAPVQRAAPDGGSADGGSLLAAEPTTFPVLHVDPSPLQRSDSRPEAHSMTLPPSLPDTGLTWPAASLPGPGMSAPATGQASSPRQPGGSSRPRRDSGSIPDGGATYVQIPSAPAVQRTTAGPAESSPSFGHVPRPSRLGLGMPLSFSEPAAESAAAAEGPPGHFPEPFPLPVQRASAPDPASSPLPHATVDEGHAPSVERVLPDAGVGAGQKATEGTATDGQSPSRQATAAAAGTSHPPGLDLLGAPDTQTQEPLPEAASGTAAEAAVPPPSEAKAAPLLSAAGSAGTLELAEDRHASEDDYTPRATGTSPAMPVISRLSTDVPRTVLGNFGHHSELEEAHIELPADVASVPEPTVDPVVAHSDDDPPTSPVSAEPVRPPSPDPGSAGTHVVAPAAIPPLHRSASLQRNIATDAPAATVPPAEDQASRAELPLPPHGPGGSRSPFDPLGSGKADAGTPENAALPILLTVPGVQRVPGWENAPQARAIPTSAGPVVLRVVQSRGRDSAPESWQRLTVMPVVAPPVPRQPASLTAVGVQPELSPGEVAGSEVSDKNGAAEPGSADQPITVPAMPLVTGAGPATAIDTDSGFGGASDLRAADASEPEAATASDVATDELPEPSAAVGRVIQRTISVPREGTAEGAARTWPGSPVHMLTDARRPAPQTAGPQSPSPSVSMQRSGAFGATPGRTRSAHSPWAPESGFASPAPIGFHAGPAASEITGSRPETSPPLTLSLASVASPDRWQYENVLQREAEFPAPDSVTAAPGPPAPSTSALEGADGGSSVHGAESAPAGPGLPGPAAKGPAAAGAAAPGNAAQASPEQLEELAKRLAGPLIRRIKAEMLLDRERRGLRTDAN